MHKTQSKSPKVVCILFIKKNIDPLEHSQKSVCNSLAGLHLAHGSVRSNNHQYSMHICLRNQFLAFQPQYQHWQDQKAVKGCQGENVKAGIIYKNLSKRLGERVTTIGTINERCTK